METRQKAKGFHAEERKDFKQKGGYQGRLGMTGYFCQAGLVYEWVIPRIHPHAPSKLDPLSLPILAAQRKLAESVNLHPLV